MNWRFAPLAECVDAGLAVPSRGKPRAAVFLTPEQAKAIAKRKAAA